MSFSTQDTIVAIATPPGRGGIGVVRLSGPDAHPIARQLITHGGPLQPRHATFTKVRLKPPFDGAQGGPEALERPDTTEESACVAANETNVSVVSGFPPPLRESSAELRRGLAVRGGSPPAFGRRCIPPGGVAPLSNIPDILGRRALPAGRIAALGATADFHHGLLAEAPSAKAGSRTVTNAIDQIVATFFPAPASYTGEDVVELSAHGSPVVLRAIVSAAIANGARPAEPGEFTLRAFLNGRMDLMQAEAVSDLIDAATPLQARAAFDQLDGTLTRAIAEIDATLFDLVARLEASVDFPDEGYHFVEPGALARAIDELIAKTTALLADARRGRLIREGLQVAIVGEPNVGKSSLFNALVGAPRAIVTDVPGTTRDLVTEVVDIHGLRVTLVDTAGLRETDDPIEIQGVARSRQSVAVSDLILMVEDRSSPRNNNTQVTDKKRVIVASKSDLPAAWDDGQAVAVSVVDGAGLDELRRRILSALDVDLLRDRPAITNVRHIALVERAHQALERARAAAFADGGSMSEEFVLADLADARVALEEISGRRAPEDLLAHIFSRFCIGK